MNKEKLKEAYRAEVQKEPDVYLTIDRCAEYWITQMEIQEKEILQKIYDMGAVYETMDTRSAVQNYKNLYGGATVTAS